MAWPRCSQVSRWLWVPGVAGALLLASCRPRQEGPTAEPTKPPPAGSFAVNRPLVEAPQEQKVRDFTLNPPQVEEATLQDRGGRTVLMVKYAADPRLGSTVTIDPDGDKIVLRDDGTEADATRGDRIFSGFIPMSMEDFRTEQEEGLKSLPLEGDAIQIPTFRGRERIGVEKLSRRALSRTDLIRLVVHGFANAVKPENSLMVTNTAVVEDPGRTFNPCTQVGNATGVWTFGHLMTEMANQPMSGVDPAELTRSWLAAWESTQTVNSFAVPPRPNILPSVVNPWPKLPNGNLDLTKAPMRLLAIVNRIDLASNLAYGGGSGGEGRFVFGVMDVQNGCSALPFLIIFEYGVPRHTCVAVRDWAKKWKALGAETLGSAQYNQKLEKLTEEFVKAGAEPTRPNGSAINQVRTNEIALAGPWELREFNLLSVGGAAPHLHQATVKQNPDAGFNAQTGGSNGALTAQWINLNESAILMDKHTVTELMQPVPPFPANTHFLGAASPNGVDFWNAAGINLNDARHHFSLNTCNACHGRETNTGFTHVANAPFGTAAPLSGFLTGIDVPDPISSVNRHFADLERRAQVLDQFASKHCVKIIGFRPILMSH
jgi:hypothetical protein